MRAAAMVLVGGMLATGIPTAAMAAMTPPEAPPAPVAISGEYDFTSMGQVRESVEQRTALSGDGSRIAFGAAKATDSGELEDDGLWLIDTTNGARQRVFEGSSKCTLLSHDGGIVVFSGRQDGISVPSGVNSDAWAFRIDVEADRIGAFPVPDLSLRGDAYDDRLCPLSISADGRRVLFTLWDRLFLADWSSGDPVAVPLLDGLDRDHAPTARLSADGTRMLVDGARRWWDSAIGERKDAAVYDIDAALKQVWSKELDTEQPVAMSADGGTVAWLERGATEQEWEDPDGVTLVVAGPETGTEVRSSIPISADTGGRLPDRAFVALSADGGSVFATTYEAIHRLDRATGTVQQVADASAALAGDSCAGDCTPLVADLEVGDDGRTLAFLLTDYQSYREDAEPMRRPEFVVGHLEQAPNAPPAWSDGAAVRTTSIGASFASIEWDAATDDRGVTGYEVSLDGRVVETTATSAASFDGLESDTTYAVAVVPVDADGARGPALTGAVQTTAPAELAALSATAQPDGTVLLRWDPAASDGYRVLRSIGDGVEEQIAELTEATWIDTGAPAESTLTYRVALVSGTVHTAAAAASTAAIPEPAVTWTTSRLRGGLIAVTEKIGLEVVGQPHRQVTATLTGKDADGSAASVQVALAEDGPGRYTGALENVVGMSVIDTVHALVGDGHGHETRGDVVWTTVPAPVSGAIDVTLDADASATGIVLDIAYPSTFWSHQGVFGDEKRMLVPTPPSAGASVTLWRPDGERGGGVAGVVVQAGEIVAQTVGLRHPAALAVTVTGPDGSPLPDIIVEVNVPGAPNATSGVTGADGVTVSTGWSNRMRAEVRLSSKVVPLHDQAPTIVDLVPGENAITIEAPLVREGIVRGVVTRNGVAVPESVVRLTQVAGGVAVVRTTRTGQDGSYSLSGFHGEASLEIGNWGASGKRAEVVIGPRAVVVDHPMIGYGVTQFDGRVRIQPFGAAEPGPAITIDGSVVSHMRVRVESESDGVWRRDGSFSADGTWSIHGLPGRLVRICADAWEAGGPAGCGEPVVTTADGATIYGDVVLRSRARLSMDLTDYKGDPLTGPWKAAITDEDGGIVVVGDGPRLETDLPAGGVYQVWVNHRQYTTNYGVTTVEVADGAHLRHPQALLVGRDSGPFSGEGNALVALRQEVMAGDMVELRATFRAKSAVAEAELRVTLPPGWAPAPDGATVDGVAVAVRQDGDRAVIGIGDIVEGAEGIVRLVLQVPDSQSSDTFQMSATIAAAGAARGFVLGQTGVRVAEVELVAPQSVSERSVLLTGRAPAGSIVSIFENDTAVGIALAGPTGHWEARAADLRVTPVGHAYRLRAAVEIGGVEHSSVPVFTTYDPYRPQLTEVAMLQDDRAVRFDPADGVARFPFVYSGRPVRVQLSFDHPGLVRAATVWFGDRSAEAVRGDDGRFTAEFPLKFGQEGDISVTFEADRLPADLTGADLGLPATLEAARALLPPTWRDFVIDDIAVDKPGNGAERMVATARIPAAGGADPIEMSLTVSVKDAPDAAITEESTLLARAAGVPVHHATLTTSGGGRSGTATGLFAPEAPSAMRAASILPFAAAPPVPLPRWLTITWDIVGGLDSINSLFQTGERFDKMQRTLRELDEMVACTPEGFEKLRKVRERARPLLNAANDLDIFGVVSNVVSTSAGTVLAEFPVASIAVGEAIWGLGQRLQTLWDGEYDAVRAGMKLDEDCGKKPKPPQPPIAQPIPIYDPSGYVFEAVESNRLEGVTATVLHAATADGPWQVWDAEWYGQRNPHDTDVDGRYGWDVPIGYWQVRYEKTGYVTGFSDVLKVLPPHFDVNVGLAPVTAPEVARMTAAPEGVLIEFTQHMRADWFGADSVTVRTADTAIDVAAVDAVTTAVPPHPSLTGVLVPVNAVTTPGGVTVAKAFRFVLEDEPAEGRTLEVLVRAGVRNHVDRPMIADATASVTVKKAPDPGSGDPGDGDPGSGGPGDGDPGGGGSPWPGGGDPGGGGPGGQAPGDGTDPRGSDPVAALPATGVDPTVPLIVAVALLLLGLGLRRVDRLRARRAASSAYPE